MRSFTTGSLIKCLLVLSLISPIIIIGLSASDGYNKEGSPTLHLTRRTDHAPISISGDLQLSNRASSEGWPGSGTQEDPYLISGYRIYAQSENGIEISGTRAYLDISDCNVSHSSEAGIELNDCQNITVKNNLVIENQGDGIRLVGSENCRVMNNTMRMVGVIVTNYNGIKLMGSSQNNVSGNVIYLSVNDAVRVDGASAGNHIFNNTFIENSNNAVYLGSGGNLVYDNEIVSNKVGIKITSDDNSIKNNRFRRNSWGTRVFGGSFNLVNDNIYVRNSYGLDLQFSTENTLRDNYILKSKIFGVTIDCPAGADNTIISNTFYYNNASGPAYDPNSIQARDINGGNRWSTPDKGGNYWYDWDSPDGNGDGWVDDPYELVGDSDEDERPLINAEIPDVFRPPRRLQAEPGRNFINLSWTPTYYRNDIPILFYVVYRSEREGGELQFDNIPGSSDHFVDHEVIRGRTYYYYITAWTYIGESNASNRVKSSPDKEWPTVSVKEPSEGEIFNTPSVNVTYKGKDNIDIERYEISIDGSEFRDNGLWENYTITGLEHGEHNFSVKAYDRAEHFARDDISFYVDLIDPEVQFDIDEEGPLNLNTDQPTFRWTGSDVGSGISGYSIRIDNGSWNFLGLSTEQVIGPLAEGKHNISISCTDRGGNRNTSIVSVFVDTLAPELTILTPLPGSFFNRPDIELSWTSSDQGLGIDMFHIKFDKTDWVQVREGTSYTYPYLDEGLHHLYVRSTDHAGNSIIEETYIIVDLTDPSLEIDYPREGDYYNGPFSLSWSGRDTISDLSIIRTRLDGGGWTEHGLNDAIDISPKGDGVHILDVELFDMAGNSQNSTVRFRYDATRPDVVSYAPSGEELPLDSSIIVTFSEEMARSTVTITVTDLTGNISWTGLTARFLPDSPLIRSRDYSVSVSGQDLAGNPLNEFAWTFSTLSIKEIIKGTVTGRVLNSEGDPVIAAKLRFRSGEIGETDSNGEFSVKVKPGSNRVILSKDPYKEKSVDFSLEENGTEDLGEIVLEAISSEGGDDKNSLSIIVIISVVFIILLLAVLGIAYQIKKTKEYKQKPAAVDEWVTGEEELPPASNEQLGPGDRYPPLKPPI